MQCPVHELLYKQQEGLGLAQTAALDTTTAAQMNPSKEGLHAQASEPLPALSSHADKHSKAPANLICGNQLR